MHFAQELEGIKAELEDRGIEYPDYYLQVCARAAHSADDS